MVKNLLANAGDMRDVSSILGLGRSPGGGYGNSFKYSCLENLLDRGTWCAAVHMVAKSQTLLKRLTHMHACIHTHTHTHTYMGLYRLMEAGDGEETSGIVPRTSLDLESECHSVSLKCRR